MSEIKKVFYWSPHINPQVATVRAVINSAKSLNLYSKNYKVSVINVFGEWDQFEKELNKFKINLINLTNIKKKLPVTGFIKSRIFYIFISLISLFKLFKMLQIEKPDYFISHLIIIPTLIISRLTFHNIKFILRISGLPKLNFFRKTFWKFLSKNIFAITCPTMLTKQLLLNKGVFNKEKIYLLRDPVINILDLPKKRKIDVPFNNYVLAVGRLTYQKNFEFLIKNYSEISNLTLNKKLIIIGSGENKKKLLNLVKKLKADKLIKIIDYMPDIDCYFKNADCFILTSRWEDPGFVLLEAAINNTPVLSNDSLSGPKEFIKGEINGYSFKENNCEEFKKKLIYLLKNLKSDEVMKKKVAAKKFTKSYSIFNHYKSLREILI